MRLRYVSEADWTFSFPFFRLIYVLKGFKGLFA